MNDVLATRPIQQALGLEDRGLTLLRSPCRGFGLLDRGPERAPLSAINGGARLGLAHGFLGGTGAGHELPLAMRSRGPGGVPVKPVKLKLRASKCKRAIAFAQWPSLLFRAR